MHDYFTSKKQMSFVGFYVLLAFLIICRSICILMNKANHKMNALTKSKLLIYALRLQFTICHSNAMEKNKMKFQYLLSSWLIDNNEKHSYTLLKCMNASAYPKTTLLFCTRIVFHQTMNDKISHNLKRQSISNWQQN